MDASLLFPLDLYTSVQSNLEGPWTLWLALGALQTAWEINKWGRWFSGTPTWAILDVALSGLRRRALGTIEEFDPQFIQHLVAFGLRLEKFEWRF